MLHSFNPPPTWRVCILLTHLFVKLFQACDISAMKSYQDLFNCKQAMKQNSDIDTGYTNVIAVALAKTAANYFVILISM